ncbi:GNAT family N-acetyltransferase [Nitrincola sp. MINF-07-Sa-05]|uniref:GNAT family N-acetyltransferase n=1 Tax=Nitrincola salilacus TaxID=3400273 RepID=UPI003917BC3B
MGDTQIRAARPDDLDGLVRLCAAHAEYEKASYEPDGISSRLKQLLFGETPSLFCVVAQRGSKLIGYATWSKEVSTWKAAFYVHLDCLYLDPEVRSHGIGKHLVAHVVRDALSFDCMEVQWQTPTFNTRAMHFYDRLGASRKEKVRFFLDETTMKDLASLDAGHIDISR